MSECICEYCHKTFDRMDNLKRHQSQTKKCLLLRQIPLVGALPFECSDCKKILSTAHCLDNHKMICKSRLLKEALEAKQEAKLAKKQYASTDRQIGTLSQTMEERYDELAFQLRETQVALRENQEKVKTLEQKLDKATEASAKIQQTASNNHHNTNSNNTMNVTIQTIMTPERVQKMFEEHYGLEYLVDGQKGLARFVNEKFLSEENKGVYQCADRSRHKFMMRQADGKLVEDPNCDRLIGCAAHGMDYNQELYEDGICRTIPEYTEAQIQQGYRSTAELDKDRSPFKSELSRLVPSVNETEPYTPDLSVFARMRAKLVDCDAPKPKSSPVHIARSDIAGISRGKLIVYRDRYRKDGTIKYPKELQLKLDAGDRSFEDEYIAFLKSK